MSQADVDEQVARIEAHGGGGGAADPTVISIGAGLDYETISEAMAAIDDAAADNVYTLNLLPSFKRAPNIWDKFQWKPFFRVEVVGETFGQRPGVIDPYGNGPFDFDRTFHGIDFSLCDQYDVNPWQVFAAGLYGVVFSCPNNDFHNVAAAADLLTKNVAVGTTYIVTGTKGDGLGGLFVLAAADYTDAANWIDATATLAGLSLNGLGLAFLYGFAANAQYVPFIGADLTSAIFTYAMLNGASFDAANLEQADFRYSKITGASFQYAKARKAAFNQANLTGANLYYSDCRNANFSGARGNAGFNNGSVAGAVFNGATIASSTFVLTDCSRASFNGADLTSASFISANCQNAGFDNAILTSANLSGADVRGASFFGATMPANADTQAEFKAVVGAWDPVTTIWTDGNPIG